MTLFLDLRENTILIVRQISYVSFASLSVRKINLDKLRILYKSDPYLCQDRPPYWASLSGESMLSTRNFVEKFDREDRIVIYSYIYIYIIFPSKA